MQFDGAGDLEIGYYDILNWQINNAGEISFVKVGEYKFQESSFELVLPKNSTLFWNTESSRVS